jgi:Neprosin
MAQEDSGVRRNDVDDDKGAGAPDREHSAEERERKAADRLDEVRQYFKDRLARREVVAVTQTPLGQVLDWVPAESMARDRKIADPPEEDRYDLGALVRLYADDRTRDFRPVELVRFELTRSNAERGPKGTVPMVRPDLDQLITTKSLADFLSKQGRSARLSPEGEGDELRMPEDDTVHKYAYSAQWVTCYGCEGNINAWDPFLEWSDEFSLGQNALARGSGSSKQTIEAGHQEYRDLYGDWVPHLFVFYTTNGYTSSGDNKGGYNQDVDGWVQYSSTIYPEALSSPVSSFGGTQYIMNLKWQLWQGNWWLRVNGVWIGYYPASLFSTSGLRNQAEKCAWYGEIVDSGSHAGTTRTDMGNGHWPYEGWQHCAYMSNLAFQSGTGGQMARYNPTSVYASHPKCYGIEGHFANTGSWGPYFWWGGSGKNSQCP